MGSQRLNHGFEIIIIEGINHRILATEDLIDSECIS